MDAIARVLFGVFGLAVLIGIAWLFSNNRRRVDWKLVATGVTGAHCIHERWRRGDFAAHIETALDLLWKRAGASVPEWLPMRYISWLPAAASL